LVVQFGWRDGKPNGVYAYDPVDDDVHLVDDYTFSVSGDTISAVIALSDLGLTAGQEVRYSAFQEGASDGWAVDFVESDELTLVGGATTASVTSVDDPSDMADSSGDIKNISAHVEGDNLHLSMTVYGTAAPSVDDTPEGMKNRYYYHWLFDTDSDIATGFKNDAYEGNPTGLAKPIGADLVVQFGWRDGKPNGVYAYDPVDDDVHLVDDYTFSVSGDTISAVIALSDLGLTAGQDGVAQKNKEAGESFLAANRDKEGVKTTDSGLQYQVTKEGTGPSPGATDSVTVNYKGTLIDGTEFDSGKGISFLLNGVIKGWTEGLQLMKIGGSTRFFIPSGLAYGTTGSGAKIGPNATLIFNIDLLSIKGKEAAKAPTPATIDPAKTDPRKIVTSDIIKVPSAEEMKKGAKIEVIKKEDLPAEIEKAKKQTEKADDKK